MIGIGIIGLGEWARTVHIPNLLRVPAARVTALASRSQRNLEAGRVAVLAGGHARPPALLTDYRDLLRSLDVDAVIVSTPNATHEALTLEALAAGKHVLCEKPLSFSLEGCKRVREAAEEAGRVFQIGLELRYADVAQRIRELVEGGEIGTPRMVNCVIWRDWGAPQGWRAGDETSGGLYLELSVHYLDLLDWLCGGGPARIYSTGGQALGTPITDHHWTTLTYESGVRVNLGICVFAPAENVIPIDLVGEKGRISADIITGRVELWKRQSGVEDRSPERPTDYGFDGFPGSVESLHAFVHSVQTGERPLAGIQAATRATSLALAAGHSERTGVPVEIPR